MGVAAFSSQHLKNLPIPICIGVEVAVDRISIIDAERSRHQLASVPLEYERNVVFCSSAGQKPKCLRKRRQSDVSALNSDVVSLRVVKWLRRSKPRQTSREHVDVSPRTNASGCWNDIVPRSTARLKVGSILDLAVMCAGRHIRLISTTARVIRFGDNSMCHTRVVAIRRIPVPRKLGAVPVRIGVCTCIEMAARTIYLARERIRIGVMTCNPLRFILWTRDHVRRTKLVVNSVAPGFLTILKVLPGLERDIDVCDERLVLRQHQCELHPP